MMRKTIIVVIAALALGVAPVYADRGYSHGAPPPHHGHGGGWVGLAIFGALTGLAIMSERTRPVYVDPYYAGPPPPVYIERQPDPAAPPASSANTWYYCGSSAMYYPYTQVCPEGWQAIPARPY